MFIESGYRVTRFEVIDHRVQTPAEQRGRVFVTYMKTIHPFNVEIEEHDEGTTVKIVLTDEN